MGHSKKKAKQSTSNIIGKNKKARHDYTIVNTYEAGISLQGWEVKSLRSGRLQLRDGYVFLKDGEAFLLGTLITPLPTAATHTVPDQKRTRKLLLHRRELDSLIGAVDRKGYTIVPLDMHWGNKSLAKVTIGLAQGKQSHDKRESEKNRDWQREKQRILRGK